MTSNKMTYCDHIGEAALPISKRRATIKGRDGKMQSVRRHHLDQVKLADIHKEMEISGKFVNPYKKYFGYWAIAESLSKLGVNQYHPIAAVIGAMKESLSEPESLDKAGRTGWDRFVDKTPKSRSNGLDWFGRITQNLNVMQRIGGMDPYALKLAQVGACIDLKADEHGQAMVQLRTGIPKNEPVVPVNELKRRKCVRSVSSLPSMASFAETALLLREKDRSRTSDEKASVQTVSG